MARAGNRLITLLDSLNAACAELVALDVEFQTRALSSDSCFYGSAADTAAELRGAALAAGSPAVGAAA